MSVPSLVLQVLQLRPDAELRGRPQLLIDVSVDEEWLTVTDDDAWLALAEEALQFGEAQRR